MKAAGRNTAMAGKAEKFQKCGSGGPAHGRLEEEHLFWNIDLFLTFCTVGTTVDGKNYIRAAKHREKVAAMRTA